jgi:uncharacterized protein YbjT (DUF2867 family)
VTGDLLDTSALARAFSEVATVYAITTPFEHGAGEEERQGESIIAAAVRSRVSWLILASVAAAARAPVPHFQSKAKIERSLAATELDWTVVAPSYFYENVLGSRGAIDAGRLPIALPPNRPLHQRSAAGGMRRQGRLARLSLTLGAQSIVAVALGDWQLAARAGEEAIRLARETRD